MMFWRKLPASTGTRPLCTNRFPVAASAGT